MDEIFENEEQDMVEPTGNTATSKSSSSKTTTNKKKSKSTNSSKRSSSSTQKKSKKGSTTPNTKKMKKPPIKVTPEPKKEPDLGSMIRKLRKNGYRDAEIVEILNISYKVLRKSMEV